MPRDERPRNASERIAAALEDLKPADLKFIEQKKAEAAQVDILDEPTRKLRPQVARPGEVQAQMARVAAHEAQGQQRRAAAAFKTEMDDLSDMFGKMGKGRKSRKGKGKKKGGRKTRKSKTRRH